MSFAVGTYNGMVYGLEVLASALGDEDFESLDSDVAEANEGRRTMKSTFASEPHIGTIKCMQHSPYGHWMVSGGADEVVRSAVRIGEEGIGVRFAK